MTDYAPLRRSLKRDPEEHDDDRLSKQARRDIAPRQVQPRDQRETSLVKTEPKESSSSRSLSGTNRWLSSPLPHAPTLPAEFRRPITHVTQPGSRSSAASDDPATSSTAPVLRPKYACQEPAPRQSSSSGASVNPSSPWHARPPAIHPADTWSGPGPNPYLFTARLPFETNILDTVKRVAAPGKPNEPSLSSDSLPVLPHERRAMIRKIAFHTGTTIRTGSDRCSQCQLSDTPAPPGWVRYPCTAVDPDWKKTKHRFHKCIACIFSGSLCDAVEVDGNQQGSAQKQANLFELFPDRAPSSRTTELQDLPSLDSRTTIPQPASERVDPLIKTERSVEAKGPQPSSRLDLECGEHIYSCQGLARKTQTVVKYLEDRDLPAASAALAIIETQSGNMREELDKLDESRRR